MKIFLLTESRDTKSRHAHIRNKKERKYTVKTTNENKESLIRIKDKMKIILKEYTWEMLLTFSADYLKKLQYNSYYQVFKL